MSATIITESAAPESRPEPPQPKPQENPTPEAPVQPAAPVNLAELSGRRMQPVKKPRFKFEHSAVTPPAPGSLQHWGIVKEAPAWLIAAMAVRQPVNKVWTEAEFDELAQKTAGLTLGRKGA